MNLQEVNKILSENNINPERIRINEKYLIPGIYYLYYDESIQKWASFYYDREYNEERYFKTEDQACRKFINLVFSTPENFKDYNIKEYWKIKDRGEKLIIKYTSRNQTNEQ